MNNDYTLTVIEDLDTPLSATAVTQPVFYGYAIVGVVIAAIVIAVGLYLLECNRYKKRLLELRKEQTQDQNDKLGFNLFALKEKLIEEENQMAGMLFDDLT